MKRFLILYIITCAFLLTGCDFIQTSPESRELSKALKQFEESNNQFHFMLDVSVKGTVRGATFNGEAKQEYYYQKEPFYVQVPHNGYTVTEYEENGQFYFARLDGFIYGPRKAVEIMKIDEPSLIDLDTTTEYVIKDIKVEKADENHYVLTGLFPNFFSEKDYDMLVDTLKEIDISKSYLDEKYAVFEFKFTENAVNLSVGFTFNTDDYRMRIEISSDMIAEAFTPYNFKDTNRYFVLPDPKDIILIQPNEVFYYAAARTSHTVHYQIPLERGTYTLLTNRLINEKPTVVLKDSKGVVRNRFHKGDTVMDTIFYFDVVEAGIHDLYIDYPYSSSGHQLEFVKVDSDRFPDENLSLVLNENTEVKVDFEANADFFKVSTDLEGLYYVRYSSSSWTNLIENTYNLGFYLKQEVHQTSFILSKDSDPVYIFSDSNGLITLRFELFPIKQSVVRSLDVLNTLTDTYHEDPFYGYNNVPVQYIKVVIDSDGLYKFGTDYRDIYIKIGNLTTLEGNLVAEITGYETYELQKGTYILEVDGRANSIFKLNYTKL